MGIKAVLYCTNVSTIVANAEISFGDALYEKLVIYFMLF
jgi:hypothetical protein